MRAKSAILAIPVQNKASLLITSLLALSLAVALIIPFKATHAVSVSAHVAADLDNINVNDGFAELVKAVRPAVVNISVTGSAPRMKHKQEFNGQSPELEEFFRKFFGENFQKQNHESSNQSYERKTTAVGSGFIIDPQGLVVTNNHVIDNADSIEVVFEDGTRVPATLKGTDSKTDLALLEIKVDHPLPYVVFGDSDIADVGDWVVAIGNPFGLGGTTTSGIISARGRDIQSGPLDDFIQIDASINRGNSGGPLFNTKGEVIGVNSAIYSPNGGSVGIGFAIPSSMANNVIAQLRDSGVVERGYLGVHIQALTKDIADNLGLGNSHGALVTQVVKDSPAEKAGIEAGDVILSFNDKKLGKMRDLPRFVALTADGSEVNVKIWRNDNPVTLKVSIASNEEPALASNNTTDPHPALGLQLGRANQANLSKFGLDEETVGVIVVEVLPDSLAAKRGLQQGDVIKRVDQMTVSTPEEVQQVIEQSQKDSILLLVERQKQARFVVVPMNA